MNYITRKRFKKKCICGELNLPFNTECQTIDNLILYNKKRLEIKPFSYLIKP